LPFFALPTGCVPVIEALTPKVAALMGGLGRTINGSYLVFRPNHMIHQRGGVGWVEQRETHRNERRQWVSLGSTHPTRILQGEGVDHLNASKH
jgi:hypothetical protein